MLALVYTPKGKAPVELREVPEPRPARNEALVAVRAFSLNRGELRSFVNNEEGWVPGQDVGGGVMQRVAGTEADIKRLRRWYRVVTKQRRQPILRANMNAAIASSGSCSRP